MKIENVLTYLLILLAIGVASFIFLASGEPEEVRERSLQNAKTWIKENKVSGTVSCNYPSKHYCDVIPTDPRPPIVLICDKENCRLSQ